MRWDKLVLASNNVGKLAEFAALLKPLTIKLIPQNELAIDDVPETGCTFVENALIKARHASNLSHLPALADDSGLVVPALNGAPGIYSARYAGENADSAANIQRLLAELKNTPQDQRQAYFYCVIVVVLYPTDPTPLIAIGKWHGIILESPRGQGGFGYDPIFYIPDLKKSSAELSREEKNKISHRGKALASLLTQLSA